MVAPLHNRDANAYAQGAPDTLNGGVQQTHAAARLTPGGSAQPLATLGAHPTVLHGANRVLPLDAAQETTEHAARTAMAESAPYQRHSATSKAAAEALAPRLGKLEALALDAFRAAGHDGLTDDELDAVTCATSTLRPRRVGLAQKGLLASANRTRATRMGRVALVWVAREFAPAVHVAAPVPAANEPAGEPGQMSLGEWARGTLE